MENGFHPVYPAGAADEPLSGNPVWQTGARSHDEGAKGIRIWCSAEMP